MTDLTRQNKIRDFVRTNQRPYTTTLTISLLVSNSIQTIQNCMESLQPLLAQVPSELIIVDTVGPENSDGSLAIAEKYADKVVHFKWCDDFAAARNAGLKEAHGKWFMFLDDDEWFDDVSDLIEFFNNDHEQNNYLSLSYKVHNYTDTTGTRYHISQALRCTRLWQQSTFKEAVHESLQPAYSPIKYVDSFVHHYGYAGNSNSHKDQRNIKILKKILIQDPFNMHAWVQTIAGIDRQSKKNRDRIIYLGNLALLNFKKKSNKSFVDNSFASVILGYMAQCYAIEKRWNDLITLSQETMPYLKLRNFDLCTLDFFIFNALQQLGRFNDSTTVFNEYLINFLAIQNDKEKIQRQYTPFLPGNVSYGSLFYMANNLIDFYQQNGLWNKIQDLALQLPIQEDPNTAKGLIYKLLEIAVEQNKPIIFKDIFTIKNEDSKTNYEKLLGNLINQLKATLTDEKLAVLNKILTKLDIPSSYLLLQKALLHPNQQRTKLVIQKFKKQNISCQPPFEDLLLVYLNNHLNPTEIIDSLDYDELISLAGSISYKVSRNIQEIPQLINQIEKYWESSSQRELVLMTLRRNYIFSNQITLDQVKSQLRSYVDNTLNFAHSFYKDELFTQKPSIFLPVEFQFALYLKRALTSFQQGEKANYFTNLKSALAVYHPAVSLVKRLIFDYELQQKTNYQQQNEFNQLAEQIKIKIQLLIESGQKQAALPLIKSLAELIPDDSEVIKLMNQANS